MRRTLSLLALLLAALPASAQTYPEARGETGPDVPAFWVRPGYRVTLAAQNYGESRFLERLPDGTILVSQPSAGTLTALRDTDNDGVYEAKSVLLRGYPKLHGLHLADDGHLYFTTSGAVFRVRPPADVSAEIPKSAVETVIPEGELPQGGGHWWRSIVVKDGFLYTSIGDSGNINDETATDRQKLWRFKTVGTDKTLWSSGLRNTEKLRFRPDASGKLTNDLYGADHGSDNLGARYGEKGGGPITDVFPPCEFNHYIQGFNYGHPFVTGLGLPRPEYANRPDILQLVENNTAPAWSFGAHVAPNGWTFLTKPTLTGQTGDAIVTFHGSWNARRKVGYGVARIAFDPVTGRPYGQQLLVGTLDPTGRQPLARPCDALELPNGSLLFTDSTGKLYRLEKAK